MKLKYKVALGILGILLFISISCAGHYLLHKDKIITTEYAEVYVEESLSFNFLEGKEINTKEAKKEYHFSVINTSNDSYYYNISIDGGDSKNASYELKPEQENEETITKEYPEGSDQIKDKIEIAGNETHSYVLEIKNEEKEKVIGTINIEVEKDMNTLANVILSNNEVKESSKTGISNEVATEDEGLIKSTDDDGTCYYFRGNTPNNYVSFAGFTWRIVKINGDNSVKLILNDVINNNTQFYKQDSENKLSFENSNIMGTLKAWYQSNLESYDNYISNAKFCSDTTADEKGFSNMTRLYTDHNPIFECLGENVASKIGLLTADEVAFAGASNNGENKSFYLYNPEIKTSWWTMSPAKNNNETYSFIEIGNNGQMGEGMTGTLFRGNRPVINLTKRVTVTGNGSIEDPYIVNNL